MTLQPDELTTAFKINRSIYEDFTNSIRGVLESLLKQDGLDYFRLEARTKELDSFSEKLSRDGKLGKYEQLEDITDLSAIRIIGFLKKDVDSICSLVKRCFVIDEENSIDKEVDLDPDQFGYLSIHFVASFDKHRAAVHEFRRFAGLKAEIQVRTLLQHTWAVIDTKLRYKRDEEVPRELRRRLYRISALLEAADDDFSVVTQRVEELKSEYDSKIDEGNLTIPLNAESFDSYVEKSEAIKGLLDLAVAAGLTSNQRIARSLGRGRYGRLFGTLKELEILYVGDLDKLLWTSLRTPKFFETLVELMPLEERSFRFTVAGIVRLSVIFHHKHADKKRVLDLYPFAPQVTSALLRVEP